MVEVLRGSLQDRRALQQAVYCLLLICKPSQVCLRVMSRQVSEVYVALVFDDGGCDHEAAMIRVNRSFRELLHVDREVGEDLVEVVAVLVRR